jgi:hypothetical protein
MKTQVQHIYDILKSGYAPEKVVSWLLIDEDLMLQKEKEMIVDFTYKYGDETLREISDIYESLLLEGVESQKSKKGYNDKQYLNIPLNSGDSYIFGENGLNRDVYHRTLPSSGKGSLPELNIQGEVIHANSYRITITLRRVMPLSDNMPNIPNTINTPPDSPLNGNEITPCTKIK